MEKEKSIEFLWNTSILLSRQKYEDAQPLKVHLRDICLNQEVNILSDNRIVNKKGICPKCFTFWAEGKFTVRLISCPKKNKNGRRLLRKDPSTLSGYQKKLREILVIPRDQILELTCTVCLNVTKIPFVKPKKSIPQVEEVVNLTEQETKIKTKKKKKKKELFAGLKPLAVLKNSKGKHLKTTDLVIGKHASGEYNSKEDFEKVRSEKPDGKIKETIPTEQLLEESDKGAIVEETEVETIVRKTKNVLTSETVILNGKNNQRKDALKEHKNSLGKKGMRSAPEKKLLEALSIQHRVKKKRKNKKRKNKIGKNGAQDAGLISKKKSMLLLDLLDV